MSTFNFLLIKLWIQMCLPLFQKWPCITTYLYKEVSDTHTHRHTYIFWQHFFINTYLIEYNGYFLSTFFFLLILSNYHIDLIIFGWNWLINLPWLVISQYFLPDFGSSSGEDVLQKWCNFCIYITTYWKHNNIRTSK